MEQIITEEEFNTIKNSYENLIENNIIYCGTDCIEYIDPNTNTSVLKELIELNKPKTYIKIS